MSSTRVEEVPDYDIIADAPDAIAAMREMGRPISHGTHGRFSELTPHKRLVVTHVIDFYPVSRPTRTR